MFQQHAGGSRGVYPVFERGKTPVSHVLQTVEAAEHVGGDRLRELKKNEMGGGAVAAMRPAWEQVAAYAQVNTANALSGFVQTPRAQRTAGARVTQPTRRKKGKSANLGTVQRGFYSFQTIPAGSTAVEVEQAGSLHVSERCGPQRVRADEGKGDVKDVHGKIGSAQQTCPVEGKRRVLPDDAVTLRTSVGLPQTIQQTPLYLPHKLGTILPRDTVASGG